MPNIELSQRIVYRSNETEISLSHKDNTHYKICVKINNNKNYIIIPKQYLNIFRNIYISLLNNENYYYELIEGNMNYFIICKNNQYIFMGKRKDSGISVVFTNFVGRELLLNIFKFIYSL